MAQQVLLYNRDTTPAVQSVLAGLSIDAAIDSASIGRQCFFALAGELYAYSTVNLSLYRVASPATAGVIAASAIPVLVTPAAVNSAAEHQARLWLGTLSAGTVYSWDGQYLGEDVTSLGTGPLIMAAYHEEVLAFGTNYCKRRKLNETWETVSMPGGMTSFVPRARVVYKDNLYIGGYDNGATFPGKVLKYDGTSITVANTVVSGNTNATLAGVTALTTFNSLLYYGYQKRGTGRVCKLGTYDGSTWSDAHKDFVPTADLAIGALVEYRGALMVGFDTGYLYESPGTTTSGTYSTISQSDEPATGGIFDMVPSI